MSEPATRIGEAIGTAGTAGVVLSALIGVAEAGADHWQTVVFAVGAIGTVLVNIYVARRKMAREDRRDENRALRESHDWMAKENERLRQIIREITGGKQ